MEQKIRHLKKAIEELEQNGHVWDSMTLAIGLPLILKKAYELSLEG